MKNMRKLFAMVLAVIMVMSLATTAFAAETTTGSITIQGNTEVPVTGKTFNAYKILDVKSYTAGEGENAEFTVVYTVPDAMKSFFNARYTLTGTEADYDYTVVEKIKAETNMFTFATAALEAAKTANITPLVANDDNNHVITGAPLGYYVIEDTATTTPVSALLLETSTPDITVTIKADKPPFDKVDDDESVEVGQTVHYAITSKVPDTTGYTTYTFEISDTMSDGLTFQKDVKVYIGGTLNAEKTEVTGGTEITNASGVTITNNDNGFTLNIPVMNYQENNVGDAIYVLYTAVVNKNAITEVEENSATLKYSNNPNNNEKFTTTPPDKEQVYSAKIVIDKYDGVNDDKSIKLSGAEFKLYKLTAGADTEDTADDVKAYYVATKSEDGLTAVSWGTESQATVVTTNENGEASFEGLEDGTYYLQEIKAPAGYNLVETPTAVVVDGRAAVTAYLDATLSAEDKSAAIDAALTDTQPIENNAGTELPSTGGMGTTLFYVFGAILMVVAAVLLVTKRRMNMAE